MRLLLDQMYFPKLFSNYKIGYSEKEKYKFCIQPLCNLKLSAQFYSNNHWISIKSLTIL